MLIRWLLVVVVMVCAAGRAFAATAPTAAELQTQAFDWMGKGNYPKARTLLDRAYQLTPVAQRNRAMILNRAILDVAQKSLVMRGLKELTAYLVARPGQDELATNILGGGLNVAASSDGSLMSGALWQSAYKEWNRRNDLLDKSRPGFRRWGTEWVTEEAYAKIQTERDSLRQAVIDQQGRVNAAATRAQDLLQQQQVAIQNRDQYTNLRRYLGSNTADPNWVWNQGTFLSNPRFLNAYWQADQQLRALAPDVQNAINAYGKEVDALQVLQGKVVRPQWPTKFDAVDPNGAEAVDPPVIVAVVEGATTQAAKPQATTERGEAGRAAARSGATTGPIEPLLPEKPKGVFGK